MMSDIGIQYRFGQRGGPLGVAAIGALIALVGLLGVILEARLNDTGIVASGDVVNVVSIRVGRHQNHRSYSLVETEGADQRFTCIAESGWFGSVPSIGDPISVIYWPDAGTPSVLDVFGNLGFMSTVAKALGLPSTPPSCKLNDFSDRWLSPSLMVVAGFFMFICGWRAAS